MEWHKEPCKCSSCGREWIGVITSPERITYDLSEAFLECPTCHKMTGRVMRSFQSEVTTITTTTTLPCKHSGWYHYVRFWIFKRKFLACEKCGKLIPQTKWHLDF